MKNQVFAIDCINYDISTVFAIVYKYSYLVWSLRFITVINNTRLNSSFGFIALSRNHIANILKLVYNIIE